MPTYNETLDMALSCADEWRRKWDNGDLVACQMLERDIDTLVGQWIDGRWVYPVVVCEAMGLSASNPLRPQKRSN
jgi:hypothetical protein